MASLPSNVQACVKRLETQQKKVGKEVAEKEALLKVLIWGVKGCGLVVVYMYFSVLSIHKY